MSDAVRIRFLEIGEAVKALPKELTNTEPEIPWRQIARMRDHLAHRYFMTELDIRQDAINNDLEPLREAINRMRALAISGSTEEVAHDESEPDSAG